MRVIAPIFNKAVPEELGKKIGILSLTEDPIKLTDVDPLR